MKMPTNSLPIPLCSSGHSEATDADLVVMARRGDDENNDKVVFIIIISLVKSSRLAVFWI